METTQKQNTWITKCQTTTDGSGDVIVPLPADLLAEMGLNLGDTLDLSTIGEGSEKRIILVKARKAEPEDKQ